MFKNFGIHFMTAVLIFCTLMYVLPNLSTNIKNYHEGKGVLTATRIDEREYSGRGFTKGIRRTLVMSLDGGIELMLSEQYSKYWDELQDEKIIGKTVTYYLGNNTLHGWNPVQIEIDNKIIYTPSETMVWEYLIILMTIGSTIYSGKKIYESRKSNTDDNTNSINNIPT